MKGAVISFSLFFMGALWLAACGAQFVSTSSSRARPLLPQPSVEKEGGGPQEASFDPPMEFSSVSPVSTAPPPRLSIPAAPPLSFLRPHQEAALLEGEPLIFALKANEDPDGLFPFSALAAAPWRLAPPQPLAAAVLLEEAPLDEGEPARLLLPLEEDEGGFAAADAAPQPLAAAVLLEEAPPDEGEPARLLLPLEEDEGGFAAADAAPQPLAAAVLLEEAPLDEGEPAVFVKKLEEEAAAAEAPGAPRQPIAGQLLIAAPQNLEAVFFVVDSDLLSSEAKKILDGQMMALKIFQKTARILIEGRCDNSGTASYNIGLGLRRAERVKRYLIESGIAEERMEVVSYGESRPISTDDPSQNRRVSFVLLPDS